MQNGLVRMSGQSLSVEGIKRFWVIGDPGCDGLGAATMSFFARALEAEKKHGELLREAAAQDLLKKDLPAAAYFTCASCGYTMRSDVRPERCLLGGAPHDRIFPVV